MRISTLLFTYAGLWFAFYEMELSREKMYFFEGRIELLHVLASELKMSQQVEYRDTDALTIQVSAHEEVVGIKRVAASYKLDQVLDALAL